MMKLLEVRSGHPSASLDLTYGGVVAVVRNTGGQWEMEMGHSGEVTRLGMASLHWTGALRRAVEVIDNDFDKSPTTPRPKT